MWRWPDGLKSKPMVVPELETRASQDQKCSFHSLLLFYLHAFLHFISLSWEPTMCQLQTDTNYFRPDRLGHGDAVCPRLAVETDINPGSTVEGAVRMRTGWCVLWGHGTEATTASPPRHCFFRRSRKGQLYCFARPTETLQASASKHYVSDHVIASYFNYPGSGSWVSLRKDREA